MTAFPVSLGAMPGDGVWRRPWSVPRPHGAVQDRRQVSRHQLPVHGRLRRQRLLLRGDGHAARHVKGKLFICKCRAKQLHVHVLKPE